MTDALWGALIGGLLALLASTATTWMQHQLGARERKEEKRDEAISALIRAIHHHQDWSEKSRENAMMNGTHKLPLNPLAEIEAIVSTRFPDSMLSLRKFEYAAAKYSSWSVDRMRERIKGEKQDLSQFREVYEEYTLAATNLIYAVIGKPALPKLAKEQAPLAPEMP